MGGGASTSELRRLFESGALWADRWSSDVRAALDVADPLLPVVVGALEQRGSVVICGDPGDGKSHLAQRALDNLASRDCVEITGERPLPTALGRDSLVFIRDVSALSDEEVLAATRAAHEAEAPLLITINEGPLATLAQHAEGAWYRDVRAILHARAFGELPLDPPKCLVLNLSGRQLTRAGFVAGALERLLPLVSPCGRCGSSNSCPRVVGAKLLRKSRRAKERLEFLLRLLTDGGQHLSAREIWFFLVDLFFGWECPPPAEDRDLRASGFFWMRAFDGSSPLSEAIRAGFDPLTVPMAKEDVAIWLGRFSEISTEVEYPGQKPVVVARQLGDAAGLDVFASAKRCYFFFAKDLDVAQLLRRKSLAPEFGMLLEQAMNEPRPVLRQLTGLMNRYRLALDTENELWISRHHGLAAHRRPAGLGAAAKLPIENLDVRVPFQHEASEYPTAGFFPTKIYVSWASSSQLFALDFATWVRLRSERTLTVDRDQEILDFALDLFMAQAPVASTDDPEVLVYDHRKREQTILRIRPDERKIEVLR